MMGWQWHQLDHMPRSRQITMPVIHHLVFTGRMPFLPPNQQRHSIEGSIKKRIHKNVITLSCYNFDT